MTEYIKDIKEANLSACEDASSFLQSAMWGEFKSRFGWSAKAFLVNWQQGESTPLLALCRRLAPGFSFAYIPWGPDMPSSIAADSRPAAMGQLAAKLKPLLSRNTVFVRFEPLFSIESPLSAGDCKPFLSAGLKQAAATVQAPDTVIVNLSVSCDEILSAMKPKWRYNVQLAGKKGVQVQVDNEQLEIFYNLLRETAVRDGISIHNIDYYKTLFEICENKKDYRLCLYTALHENDFLAAIIVLFRGKDATYLYGASSNIKRNLMAPYALQWQAMLDAKEAGCLSYDLFGIPPNDDPGHPMAGLYRFKTGFGGQIVHRAGGWDFPYKSFFYNLFNIAEVLRKKLRDLRKKNK